MGLEIIGTGTLVIALGVATLVQLRLLREVTSDGQVGYHNDFKIRMEERRQHEMETALAEQKKVVIKLKEAYEMLQKEKADIKAMHLHTQTATREIGMDPTHPVNDQATFENPLDIGTVLGSKE